MVNQRDATPPSQRIHTGIISVYSLLTTHYSLVFYFFCP